MHLANIVILNKYNGYIILVYLDLFLAYRFLTAKSKTAEFVYFILFTFILYIITPTTWLYFVCVIVLILAKIIIIKFTTSQRSPK